MIGSSPRALTKVDISGIQASISRLGTPHVPAFSFCGHKQRNKVQTVGFKNDAIHDFNKIAYEYKSPLEFKNGKCLVYKSKRTLAESIWRSAFYTVPISGVAAFIYMNPLAAVFPASIPIMVVVELVLIKFWFNRMKWNENLVKQIYLLENGDATEIHYSNQLKRSLFGEPLKKTYYNSVFVDPNYQAEDILVLDQKTGMFPKSLKEVSKEGYSWTKHYSNGQNYLLLPKNAEANMEVLIEIFKGKIIKSLPE